MKKVAFFVISVAVIGFLCYVGPKEAKAIIVVDGYVGPFSLADSQAVQVNIVNMSFNADAECEAEVMFYNSAGEVIENVGCDAPLRGNSVMTCRYEPEIDGGRNQYTAQIMVSNQNARECRILMTTEVYDVESRETIAVYDFKNVTQLRWVPQPTSPPPGGGAGGG